MKKRTSTENKKFEGAEPVDPEFEWVPEKAVPVPKEKMIRIKPDDKVQITILLDYELLKFFKNRAAEPNAAPYETQITNALREYMQNETDKQKDYYTRLLEDERFLDALAARLKKRKAG